MRRRNRESLYYFSVVDVMSHLCKDNFDVYGLALVLDLDLDRRPEQETTVAIIDWMAEPDHPSLKEVVASINYSFNAQYGVVDVLKALGNYAELCLVGENREAFDDNFYEEEKEAL